MKDEVTLSWFKYEETLGLRLAHSNEKAQLTNAHFCSIGDRETSNSEQCRQLVSSVVVVRVYLGKKTVKRVVDDDKNRQENETEETNRTWHRHGAHPAWLQIAWFGRNKSFAAHRFLDFYMTRQCYNWTGYPGTWA